VFDAEFIKNPYPTYQHLLTNSRIHFIEHFGGAWLVTHYDDALDVLRDARFSAARASSFVELFPPEQREQIQDLGRCLSMWLVVLDGGEHLRLRRLLNKAFTPRTIENMRPAIEQLADTLIDRLIAEMQTQGQADLLQTFAHPLPAMIIAQLLGVQAEDQLKFVRWSDELARYAASMTPDLEIALTAQDALHHMLDCFRAVLAERRREPQDDFVTLLLSAEEQDVGLTEEEILAQCTLFLLAGHETTRNLIGNGMLTLLQHPEQRALLRREPSLIRSALDEMLRYQSPTQTAGRIATEDLELFGQSIKAGQTMLILLGAVNRDPDHFSDPDRFDITRAERRPLSFGHGPHVCIGMALALLEGEIAFTRLLRLPNIQLVSTDLQWSPIFALRGLLELPITFDTQPETDDPPQHSHSAGVCPFHANA
jgi:hypothetical protein